MGSAKLITRQFSFTFFCAVVLAGAAIGTGRHIDDISKADFAASMMVTSQTPMS
jgi:hypothetical protein